MVSLSRRRALQMGLGVAVFPYRLILQWIDTGPGVKGLLPEEQALFALMANHPEQQRTTCVLHPILCKVARAKAHDIAARDYEGHVDPDGVGPNQLVINAGYKLPKWWGDKKDANFIESLTAGNLKAAHAWSSWLGSPSHRAHVLGEGFYKDQVNVGVGLAHVEGSHWGRYWILLSAPVEGEG